MEQIFRYDLASFGEPRLILITDPVGARSAEPRLGYVVLPQPKRRPASRYQGRVIAEAL